MKSASMNSQALRKLFEQVRKKRLSPDEAVERLRHMPFEDLGFAKIDHHRALRQGMPEVIFTKRKTPLQVALIAEKLCQAGRNLLITRADQATAYRVRESIPEAEYFPLSGAIRVWGDRTLRGKGKIAV